MTESKPFYVRYFREIIVAGALSLSIGSGILAFNAAYHANKAGEIASEIELINHKTHECKNNIDHLTQRINETADYMQYCSEPKCFSDLNGEKLFPLIKELSATTATCNPIYMDSINRKPELLKQVHLEAKLAWNPFYDL